MIILSPGPANISERVRQALTKPDIGHRESEFTALLRESREAILRVCGVLNGYRCALLTGSGTTGMEAAITSLKGVSRGLLILANGVYGERAAEIARVFGIPHQLERFEWTAALPIDRVAELLADTEHDAVYLIHHETTTGVLNPLRDIAEIVKRDGKALLVDAVSSIAGEELDLRGWGVDLAIGSANKCIRGVPGCSFVVLSNAFGRWISQRDRVAYSTDLISTLEKQESGETPFTPPMQTIYALREALAELLEEGVPNRIAAYRQTAAALRDGLEGCGLELFVRREHLSNTMTSVKLPSGMTYERLHREMKARGFVIYKSQSHLADTTFRLGTVGRIVTEDIRRFLDALGDVVAEATAPAPERAR